MNHIYCFLKQIDERCSVAKCQQQLPFHQRVMCSIINTITRLSPAKFSYLLGDFDYTLFYNQFLNIVDEVFITRQQIEEISYQCEFQLCDPKQPKKLHELFLKNVQFYNGYPLALIKQVLLNQKIQKIEDCHAGPLKLQISVSQSLTKTQLDFPIQVSNLSRINQTLSAYGAKIYELKELPLFFRKLEQQLRPFFRQRLHQELRLNNLRRLDKSIKQGEDVICKQIQKLLKESSQELLIIGSLICFTEEYMLNWQRQMDHQLAEL